jgi:TolB protein
MSKSKLPTYLIVGGILFCVCFLAAGIAVPIVARLMSMPAAPAPSLFFTLTAPTPIPTFSLATPTPAAISQTTAGHIVFTCQIFKYQSSEQICIMNPDGSGFRRLTTEDGIRHYYPSPSPDGKSVVYSVYREDNVYEIYEMSLSDGVAKRVTDRLGALTGPAISPDGSLIAVSRWTVASNQNQLWLMDRDGSQPRRVIDGSGWDPVWSPDGTQLLYASDRDGSNQLWVVHVDGSGLHQITHLPAFRGRSDWSVQNLIVTYSGDAWKRELYIMKADGSNLHRISPPGGDSQGPSFSPDGQWITFTAYFDHPKDINGCEIYVIRVDGTDLRRLTNNDYCDYQPRWGP